MSLKRGIFYTFLTQAPTLLLYFVSSTLMTRTLGEEGRGAYALLQNQVALVAMLLWLNTNFGIIYYTAKAGTDPSQMVRVASTVLLLNLLATPLLLLLIFWNQDLRQIFLPTEASHWGYMIFVLLAVLTAQLNSAIGSIMLGMKKFRIVNGLGIFNASLSAVGYTILYLLRDRVAPDHVLAMVLGVSLVSILIYTTTSCIIYIRVVGIRPIPTWNWTILKPFLAFVLVGYLSNLINLINYRFDIWVVGSYSGTAQLGLYAVAVGMGQLFFYIPEPFSRVVQPYLYGNMDDELLEKYKFIVRINFTSVMLLSLALGILAPWIIPLLFGKAFAGAVIALQWLLPGIIFVSATKLVSLLVVQGGLIRFNLFSTIIGAAITIVLNLLMVPQWGIVGASIASSIAYLVLLVIPCLVIRYKMGITVWDMFLLRPSDLVRIRALVATRLPFLASK